jgi:hypothetical protein
MARVGVLRMAVGPNTRETMRRIWIIRLLIIGWFLSFERDIVLLVNQE